MSSNDLYAPGYCKSVIASYPTSPASGGVVLFGYRTGIAITDEDDDGYTSVNFGPGDYNLSVTDSNTGGIAVGASLFASQATPVVLSNDSTGVFFGYANEIVGDRATATINVHHVADTGGILGSGSIGTTQLAADAVTGAKIADGAVDNAHIADATIKNAKLSTDNVKVAEVALTAGIVNAFALAWENPETVPIIVTRVLIDITTAGGTATAVLNVGTAGDATTTSDNLLGGIDANVTATYDNLLAADAGSNGKTVQKLDKKGGTTAFITAQILTEAASSLVGNAYIFYTEV